MTPIWREISISQWTSQCSYWFSINFFCRIENNAIVLIVIKTLSSKYSSVWCGVLTMYANMRTMGVLSFVVRWCVFVVVGVGWQVQSQALQQNNEVDSSYNFYYEQPCCAGGVSKSKYHARHRRGKLCFYYKYYK